MAALRDSTAVCNRHVALIAAQAGRYAARKARPAFLSDRTTRAARCCLATTAGGRDPAASTGARIGGHAACVFEAHATGRTTAGRTRDLLVTVIHHGDVAAIAARSGIVRHAASAATRANLVDRTGRRALGSAIDELAAIVRRLVTLQAPAGGLVTLRNAAAGVVDTRSAIAAAAVNRPVAIIRRVAASAHTPIRLVLALARVRLRVTGLAGGASGGARLASLRSCRGRSRSGNRTS